MENHELDQKFTQTELSSLKDDVVRVSQENQIKGQRIEGPQASIEAMRRSKEMITEILASNPSVRDVGKALKRRARLA